MSNLRALSETETHHFKLLQNFKFKSYASRGLSMLIWLTKF